MNILKTGLAALSLLLANLAFAQGPAVTSTLQVHKVDAAGVTQAGQLAEAGKPGDVVEYVGTYRNTGTTAAGKLLATIPVPVGTTFVAGSATPSAAQASTDGVRFAAMPLLRTVRQADGSTRQEPEPLSAYRFVRWDVGTLAAGRDAVVRMRVRIDSADDPAPSRP